MSTFHNKDMDLKRLLSIWWSMAWRAFLLSTLAGFVVGFVLGFVLALVGRPESAGFAGALGGWLVSIPITVWALGEALSKTHGGYKLVLAKAEE